MSSTQKFLNGRKNISILFIFWLPARIVCHSGYQQILTLHFPLPLGQILLNCKNNEDKWNIRRLLFKKSLKWRPMKLRIPVSFHSARKMLNDQTPRLRINYLLPSFLEPCHKEKNTEELLVNISEVSLPLESLPCMPGYLENSLVGISEGRGGRCLPWDGYKFASIGYLEAQPVEDHTEPSSGRKDLVCTGYMVLGCKCAWWPVGGLNFSGTSFFFSFWPSSTLSG